MSQAARELVPAKIAKAEQFLEVVAVALKGGYFDVAVSLAASAAVNASDVLCLIATGEYPTGANHSDAARRLRRAGYGRASTHLLKAMVNKNKAQYQYQRCTGQDAGSAVQHAQRLVDEALSEAKSKGFVS